MSNITSILILNSICIAECISVLIVFSFQIAFYRDFFPIALSRPCPGVKVILLPLKAPADLATKAKFRGMFDVAYFSNGMVHHLTPELGHCIAPHAHIVLEGVCHILGLTQEQKGEYATRVAAKATACGATAVGEPNAEKDAHYYYARKAT